MEQGGSRFSVRHKHPYHSQQPRFDCERFRHRVSQPLFLRRLGRYIDKALRVADRRRFHFGCEKRSVRGARPLFAVRCKFQLRQGRQSLAGGSGSGKNFRDRRIRLVLSRFVEAESKPHPDARASLWAQPSRLRDKRVASQTDDQSQ